MVRWACEVHHIFDRAIIPAHKIARNLPALSLLRLYDSMHPCPSNRIIQLDSHPNSASKLCLATETDL